MYFLYEKYFNNWKRPRVSAYMINTNREFANFSNYGGLWTWKLRLVSPPKVIISRFSWLSSWDLSKLGFLLVQLSLVLWHCFVKLRTWIIPLLVLDLVGLFCFSFAALIQLNIGIFRDKIPTSQMFPNPIIWLFS